MNNPEQGPGMQPEKAPNLEIERKFLVKSLPADLDKYPHNEILQGYLPKTGEEKSPRIRKKGDKYYKTIKKGHGKVRIENEEEITEEVFNSLWPSTEGRRIEKTRYEIPHADGTIELDVYHGDLEGFYTAEVEFSDEESCDKFVPPDWFGEEKTDDKRYSNRKLATYGLPKD